MCRARWRVDGLQRVGCGPRTLHSLTHGIRTSPLCAAEQRSRVGRSRRGLSESLAQSANGEFRSRPTWRAAQGSPKGRCTGGRLLLVGGARKVTSRRAAPGNLAGDALSTRQQKLAQCRFNLENAIGRRYTPMNADDTNSYARGHFHLVGDAQNSLRRHVYLRRRFRQQVGCAPRTRYKVRRVRGAHPWMKRQSSKVCSNAKIAKKFRS
jgi:AraC-like DNA-binding protein